MMKKASRKMKMDIYLMSVMVIYDDDAYADVTYPELFTNEKAVLEAIQKVVDDEERACRDEYGVDDFEVNEYREPDSWDREICAGSAILNHRVTVKACKKNV